MISSLKTSLQAKPSSLATIAIDATARIRPARRIRRVGSAEADAEPALRALAWLPSAKTPNNESTDQPVERVATGSSRR